MQQPLDQGVQFCGGVINLFIADHEIVRTGPPNAAHVSMVRRSVVAPLLYAFCLSGEKQVRRYLIRIRVYAFSLAGELIHVSFSLLVSQC